MLVPPEFPREKRRTVLWILLLMTFNFTSTGLSPSMVPLSSEFELGREVLKKVRTPHLPYLSTGDSVCPLPLSVALINGISIDFFSSGY